MADRVPGLSFAGRARLGCLGRAVAIPHTTLNGGPSKGAKYESPFQARSKSKTPTVAVTSMVRYGFGASHA